MHFSVELVVLTSPKVLLWLSSTQCKCRNHALYGARHGISWSYCNPPFPWNAPLVQSGTSSGGQGFWFGFPLESWWWSCFLKHLKEILNHLHSFCFLTKGYWVLPFIGSGLFIWKIRVSPVIQDFFSWVFLHVHIELATKVIFVLCNCLSSIPRKSLASRKP